MTQKAFFEEHVSTPDIYRNSPFQFEQTAALNESTEFIGEKSAMGIQWDEGILMPCAQRLFPENVGTKKE